MVPKLLFVFLLLAFHSGRCSNAGSTDTFKGKLRETLPTGTSPGGAPLLYQLPSSTGTNQSFKGVVFFFHGCSHSGSDWNILPIERIIVDAILQRGYIAVALTSLDRSRMCWDRDDFPGVASSIQLLRTHLQLSLRTPIFLLGASSGGSFVFEFARISKSMYDINISAICVHPHISGSLDSFHEWTNPDNQDERVSRAPDLCIA